ncbi:hypothetical protein SteCoe_23679 [Stentor coeruleus]|uniref:NAD(+) ADP-ribosyltransferase n=1 Tax=Stentor coeruleus TaxID=5963 RepID=A0A1R2BJF3_9CILI|nr:hypothetical protein SteCoe_23679 [Stentor coeruleus]
MSIQDLHAACKSGDISAIKLAFQSNPSKINEKDSQLGWSPLYRTVISGRIEATKFLLEQGADPNMANNLGETPLHQVADNGNCLMAKLLIDYGGEVNHQQNEGDTPLHHSAFRGDAEMVQLLLNEKGDSNIRNRVSGRTPLHYAVDCGFLECVDLMIKYKANPFIQDNFSKTAFDLTHDPEILASLSKKPEDDKQDESDELSLLESFEEVLEIAYEKDPKIDATDDMLINKESDFDGDYSPGDFVIRGSFSSSKLTELLKNGKIETTAVSSHKSTSQNKIEIHPIYDWLEKIKLAQYYEHIVSAGYLNLDQLIKDMPTTEKTLFNFIIVPGHRKRMMFYLNEEADNVSRKLMIYKKRSQSFFRCCGISGNNTQGINSIPSILDWLREISMDDYFTNFLEAGYDDYESLVMMSNTDLALTAENLISEVKITKKHHIQKILKRIEADHINFCSRQSMNRISFDEPKNVACESCGVF